MKLKDLFSIGDGGNKTNETIQPFVFKSDSHQRYQNGNKVGEIQQCFRTLSVEKNVNGCRGYRLAPGDGYIVKIYNDDIGKPNMSDKPMRIVSKNTNKIELRGFPIDAMAPFGWQEVANDDYGLTVYYLNDRVERCVFHMFDRKIDIEYRALHMKDSIEGSDDIQVKIWTKPVSHDILFKRSISFHVNRYEQWQQGKCTDSGKLSFDIHLIAEKSKISVEIPEAQTFKMPRQVSFAYTGASVLRDRIQYLNSPDVSEDPTYPLFLHIFVKNKKLDCIRFAMSFPPDRIIEFYGYQIESKYSMQNDFDNPSSFSRVDEDYKLTFLSTLFNVAACDGIIAEEEMQMIVSYMKREGLVEADLLRVMTNPESVPHSIPSEPQLRLQHIRDVVALSMVDSDFNPREYALCKRIAIGLGASPEIIDVIRQEINDQIGTTI